MKRLFQRRSLFSPSLASAIFSYLALGAWTVVVLFPLYWLIVTSLKTPLDVSQGPVYLPFVDFQPVSYAWHYIFVDLGNDTLRPYINTVIVSLVSSTLALLLGTTAAYGLVRFNYRPRLGAILLFLGGIALAIVAVSFRMPWQLALIVAGAILILLLQTIGRRFKRSLSNNDIAFWLISTRILPPIVVVLPIYIFFQQLRLLDTKTALIISYVAVNLPIVVWLMRDYFTSIPLELEESAALDGASRFRIFRAIVLPLSVPGLVATFLLMLVFTWNEYLLALFLSGAKSQTMPLLVAAMNGTRGTEWWYMSVVILIMIIPVVITAIVLERYIERGLLIGAIKG